MTNNTRDLYMRIFDYIDKRHINYYDDLIRSLRSNNEADLLDFAVEYYGPVFAYLQNPHTRQ